MNQTPLSTDTFTPLFHAVFRANHLESYTKPAIVDKFRALTDRTEHAGKNHPPALRRLRTDRRPHPGRRNRRGCRLRGRLPDLPAGNPAPRPAYHGNRQHRKKDKICRGNRAAAGSCEYPRRDRAGGGAWQGRGVAGTF